MIRDLEVARVQGQRWRNEARSVPRRARRGDRGAVHPLEPDRGRARGRAPAPEGPEPQGDRDRARCERAHGARAGARGVREGGSHRAGRALRLLPRGRARSDRRPSESRGPGRACRGGVLPSRARSRSPCSGAAAQRRSRAVEDEPPAEAAEGDDEERSRPRTRTETRRRPRRRRTTCASGSPSARTSGARAEPWSTDVGGRPLTVSGEYEIERRLSAALRDGDEAERPRPSAPRARRSRSRPSTASGSRSRSSRRRRPCMEEDLLPDTRRRRLGPLPRARRDVARTARTSRAPT